MAPACVFRARRAPLGVVGRLSAEATSSSSPSGQLPARRGGAHLLGQRRPVQSSLGLLSSTTTATGALGLGLRNSSPFPFPSPSRQVLVRAGGGGAEGQITGELMASMQAKIEASLEAASVVVEDTSGDGSHVSIDVVSTLFEGKTSVQRQRLVYKSIWEELQSAVHAVDAMTCKTPQEAGLE